MNLSIAETDISNVTGLRGCRLSSHQRRKKAIVQLMLKTCPVGSSILDVGCACGDISVELSLLGYRVHGTDFEPVRLNKAKDLADKHGQRIIFEAKSFEEFGAHSTFDVVLLGEVLEHFAEPANVLSDIKNLLNMGGKVVITTPNMPSLRNRLAFGLLGIFPDNNPEHKYYFDFRRFSNVVSAADYEVLYFRTRFTNIMVKSKLIACVESILLFWFTHLFPKSGDTILAVIGPRA